MRSAPRLKIVNLEKQTEVDEPEWYAADLEDTAGLQDFEAQLIHDISTLEVQVPRGLRTHGSSALAGQLQHGSAHPICVPTKRYEVTVEPGANDRKPKEFLREYWRPFSEVEFDLLQSREQVPPAELNTALDPRFCFRNERQSTWQATRRFPALVSPRILPSWRRAEPSAKKSQKMPGGRGRRGATLNRAFWASSKGRKLSRSPSRSSERILAETSSMSVKRKVKREFPEDSEKWRPVHTAGAHIPPRSPALFAEEYEGPRKEKLRETLRSRERQMSETDMLPPSRVRSQSEEELWVDSQLIRHWGRQENNRLQALHRRKLKDFRKEHGMEIRRSVMALRSSVVADVEEDRPPVNREISKSPDPVSFLQSGFKRRFTVVAGEAESSAIDVTKLKIRGGRQRKNEGGLSVPGGGGARKNPSRGPSRAGETPAASPRRGKFVSQTSQSTEESQDEHYDPNDDDDDDEDDEAVPRPDSQASRKSKPDSEASRKSRGRSKELSK